MYRLRVGDYRILYKVSDQELVVLVVEIASRQSVYDFLKRLKKMPPLEP